MWLERVIDCCIRFWSEKLFSEEKISRFAGSTQKTNMRRGSMVLRQTPFLHKNTLRSVVTFRVSDAGRSLSWWCMLSLDDKLGKASAQPLGGSSIDMVMLGGICSTNLKLTSVPLNYPFRNWVSDLKKLVAPESHRPAVTIGGPFVRVPHERHP